jgi:hypothetical protein
MSLMTEAIVADKYGLRLGMDELSQALKMARNTIYNQIAAGTFRVPTYLDGGKRWADYRDVASYVDACQARAKAGERADSPA